MPRPRDYPLILTMLATVLMPGALAQVSDLKRQLGAMEQTIFRRVYSGDTAIHRIERLEGNFPEPSKQKQKDLPVRLTELMERVKPDPKLLESPEPPPDLDANEGGGLDKFKNGTKDFAHQAVGAPKSIMNGTRGAFDKLFGGGNAATIPSAASKRHIFSGGPDSWSQDSSVQDWYRPSNLRGFTPYYVDGGNNRGLPQQRRPVPRWQYDEDLDARPQPVQSPASSDGS